MPLATVEARPQPDPELLSRQLPDRGPQRLALGLDLGTRCGYAYALFKPGEPYEPGPYRSHLGQFDLSVGEYDSGAIRFVRMRRMLEAIGPDIIFYEEPRFTPPAGMPGGVAAVLGRVMTAAELLGGLKATLVTWCEEKGVPCQAYAIGTIKKFATGKGNANKGDMIAAINGLLGIALVEDDHSGSDNMADAASVLLLGLSEHARATQVRRAQGAGRAVPVQAPGRA